jgi:hypothetical protein
LFQGKCNKLSTPNADFIADIDSSHIIYTPMKVKEETVEIEVATVEK